jgi:hypothetical protein
MLHLVEVGNRTCAGIVPRLRREQLDDVAEAPGVKADGLRPGPITQEWLDVREHSDQCADQQ